MSTERNERRFAFNYTPLETGMDNEVVILTAENFNDLTDRLREVFPSVPYHPKKRKRVVEVYCLVSLLAALPWSADQFPIKVVRSEHPDFVVRCGGAEFGLEHTEAIGTNHAKERALRADGFGGPTHFVTPEDIHDAPKSSATIIGEILCDAMGDGWVGDSAERSWAEAMAYFISKKSTNAKKPGYGLFGDDRLMIYDNWNAPALQHEVALEHLGARLLGSDVWDTFSHIYIVSESLVIDLCEGHTTFHALAAYLPRGE